MQCPYCWWDLDPAPGGEEGRGAVLHALLHLFPPRTASLGPAGTSSPLCERGWPAEKGCGSQVSPKPQCSLFQYCYMGKWRVNMNEFNINRVR